MSFSLSVFPHFTRKPWPRRAAIAGLAGLLFLTGIYDAQLLAALSKGGQALLGLVGVAGAAGPAATSPDAPHRPSLAFAGYAALYLGLCLLLLRLLLRLPAQWLLARRVYGGIIATYVLLVLVSKIGGNLLWAYRLSRYLLGFIISPLPVLLLVVLLRGPRLGPGAKSPGSQRESG